jgi:hypothetical protein
MNSFRERLMCFVSSKYPGNSTAAIRREAVQWGKYH